MQFLSFLRRSLKHIVFYIFLFALFSGCRKTPQETDFFHKAQPVWPAGLQYEKNVTAGFRAQFENPRSGPVILKITGSSLYRIYLNGEFAGHGPARAGHGYYRMDTWDLTGKLRRGENILAIEAAGYNVNSYYLLDQPSFIQAELVSGNKVLAATAEGGKDFQVSLLPERMQKVPRYSFQRPFTEVYQLEPGYDLWREDPALMPEQVECEYAGMKNVIPRRVAYPDFKVRRPVIALSHGELKTGIKRENYWKDRAVRDIGPKLKGFPEEELTFNPAIELQEMENSHRVTDSIAFPEKKAYPLETRQYHIFDMGTNLTGFPGAELEVTRGGRFFFTFDEILKDGDVDFKRLGCINAVTWDLAPGKYELESIEPYTFRYLKVIAATGECTLKDITLREYANPDIDLASFNSSDPRLNRIFDAGVETFRQNAVDIFMDCPHRERAGWLCDSYFTSRVAMDLSGNTLIEKNFFENYLLPDSFACIPEGMLPMCYPADHYNGVFIPNWAMWFVVELKEYLYRSQDHELIDALEPRVMALLDYFEPFRNEDGLLEKLESWIFVEWSAANNFVQDVNYPTNMLYAATLDATGDLYGRDDLKEEAAAIRETIREQSYNGSFFVDNAVRNDQGKLEARQNTTEVCQYFAFFFDVATPEKYPELWERLAGDFGPARREDNAWPDVHFANAFVGNYLRLELLSRFGLPGQILEESIGFFDYMAQETGTLWENISPYASCNHGFASHVVHVLYRDVLGVKDVNTREKRITLQFPDIDLDFCEGKIPVGDDLLILRWDRQDSALSYHYGLPDGFEVIVEE